MLIHDIADFLVNLTCKDIKPDIYSVFDSPCENNCPNNVNSEKLTILEILNAIGCRLKNLFGFVKINTTTETIDEGDAVVNVNGAVDNLNFDFKIPRGKTGPQGPQGEPGQANLVVITATASASGQGEYIPDTTYSKALADIQANKAVMIKLENVPGRYYIPYSSSNTEILASAGTISGSKQSIELYTLKWIAQTNIITLTGTKKGCIADGGTTGQVLVKKSDESFDTEWKFQYRIILSNQPFNTAELIEQFNNGSLIYFYNIRTSSLYRIYNISNDSLYGINTLSINTTTRKITNYICKLQNNKFIPYEDIVYSVPNGGTSGQILAKKSNANGDTEWIDFYPYVPVGGVFEWDGTGIPNAPDLSTPEKVAAFYGYGTWERYGVDRVTIGAGGEYAAGSTGGEKEHTLTIEEMPNHNHSVMSTYGQSTSQTFYPLQMLTKSGEFADMNAIFHSGGSQPHNNMQPYIGAYKYRRIA